MMTTTKKFVGCYWQLANKLSDARCITVRHRFSEVKQKKNKKIGAFDKTCGTKAPPLGYSLTTE